MRRAFVAATCLAASLGLSGCVSGFNGAPATTIDAAKVSSCPVIAKGDPPNASAYYASGITDDARREARNAFIDKCASAIQISYRIFEQGLSSDQKSFAVGTDVATTGLTAAATLAKSARTKTHLTTYASVVLGLRGSVEKELFLSKTLPALISQMNASRDAVKTRIIQNKARPTSEYSLDAALADLDAYYQAGTLVGALTEVTSDAGVKAATAKNELKRVSEGDYSYTDAGQKLRRFWRPDGAINEANQAKLRTWLNENAGGRSISELIYGIGVPPNLQAQAVKDLNIQ